MRLLLLVIFFIFHLSAFSQADSYLPDIKLADSVKLKKVDSASISDACQYAAGFHPSKVNLPDKDSLLNKSKSAIKFSSTKMFFKSQFKEIKPHGNISLGYEYGVLPSVSGGYPTGGYRTEGQISFLLLKLPLELNFSYSDIKNTIGINNYFRLSYDASRYKEQMEDKLNVKDRLMSEQLQALQQQQSELKQNMDFLSFLQNNPTYNTDVIEKNKIIDTKNYPDSTSFSQKINDSILKQTNNKQINDTKIDSLKPLLNSKFSQTDTSAFFSYKDSLIRLDTANNDSVKNTRAITSRNSGSSEKLNETKIKYDSISQKITEVQKQIEQIKAVKENPMIAATPQLSKIQSFMRNVKKIEIGMCHPTSSTFLVNNIPLQGINFEYGTDEKFLSVCYGTTINPILFNTNTIQGSIDGARNLYNYFDFGNLSSGRKIFSIKGGFGKKDDTHLFGGFLIGKGRSDYLSPTADQTSTFSKESNLVAELDGKYKFSEHVNVDLVVGKSSVMEEDLSMEQLKKGVNEIFSNYRSYALLGRLNVGITKTKTKLTFTTRWIDPYFKSFGVGFLRSDNLRYEIKADQVITKKIRYTVSYRREEDNILKLFNYSNVLQSINNSLNLKISRQVNIRINYVPLFRELKGDNINIKDVNQITTVVFSYVPRPRIVNAVFNALYSKYIISGDTTAINFENISYSHTIQGKSGFKTGLNVSWFKNSLKDTLNNDTYLALLDIGYSFKKGNSFTLGGKAAWKKEFNIQYGFVAKISLKVYKGLFWEAEAEKILVGDYYNSFIIGEIEKFPYYCNTRMILKF